METTVINLYKQTRDRGLSEYLSNLNISRNLLKPDKSVLAIGGGYGIYDIAADLECKITNIDLETPHPGTVMTRKYDMTSIQGDFTNHTFKNNSFDEIWALYSLPFYSVSDQAAEMFFCKAALALKPCGFLRIAPIHRIAFETRFAVIERKIPIDFIIDKFTECLYDFSDLGGNVNIYWENSLFNDRIQNYEMSGCKPPRFSGFDKKGDNKIKHFRMGFLDDRCGAGCAIISKPAEKSDEINKALEYRIKNLEKCLKKYEIVVKSNRQTIRY